jgi:hypothetical protein
MKARRLLLSAILHGGTDIQTYKSRCVQTPACIHSFGIHSWSVMPSVLNLFCFMYTYLEHYVMLLYRRAQQGQVHAILEQAYRY